MQIEEATRILYAITRDWREDPLHKGHLQLARKAVAQAIWQGDGQGFPAGKEPSAADFADPTVLAAWQACHAEARTTQQGSPGSSLVFIVSQSPPDQRKDLTDVVPALKTVKSAQEGPFLVEGTTGQHTLYIYNQMEGMPPGIFPRAETAVERYRLHALSPGGMFWFLVSIVAFAAIAYGAYRNGAGLSFENIISGFPARLADAMAAKTTDKPFRESVQDTAAQVTAGAALVPTDGKPWWLGSDGKPQPVSAATITAKTTAALALLDPKLSGVPTTEQKAVRDALAAAIASDPLFKRHTVNLAAWWLGAMLPIVGLAMVVGYGFFGSVVGVLVDSRNRLSLSKLQMMLWTALVLSLFAVTSAFLIGASEGTVHLPVYPGEIWALLGLSLATVPLSGLILLNKTHTEPQPQTQARVDADPKSTNRGLLDVNLSRKDWSVLDFFRGEEVTNKTEIDVARLQHFVITLTLIIIFIGLGYQMFWALGAETNWDTWATEQSYPPLNQTFLGLLALSHGGYLVMKALNKPDTAPTPQTRS